MRPQLSWVLESHERDQRQTAYHVLVASQPELLASGKGDLWDSGQTKSAKSVHVNYGGAPLTSRLHCYWKVRVWDVTGHASAWSRPASWEMGLLRAED